MEYKAIKFDLERLIDKHAVLVDVEPEWIGIPPEDVLNVRRANLYLVINEDICIPVEETGARLIALTVLARGSISDLRRKMRNERKQAQRARRAASRQNKAWLGEKAPRWR